MIRVALYGSVLHTRTFVQICTTPRFVDPITSTANHHIPRSLGDPFADGNLRNKFEICQWRSPVNNIDKGYPFKCSKIL